MEFDLLAWREDPIEEASRLMARLGRRWDAVLALPLALLVLLLHVLPRRAARAGAPERERILRHAGLQTLGWAAGDLALTAALPLLRLSFPPIRGAWFYLFCGRATITAGAVMPALASAVGGADLPVGGRRGLVRLLAAAHAAMGAVLIYATYIEGQRLVTRRTALRFPGRSPGAPPLRLRIAHLSDIHMERLTRRDEAVIDRLRAAQPDLILLSGDFISIDYYDARAYEDLRALMTTIGSLAPPHGVYACLGNVDPPEIMRTTLLGTGVTLLEDTAVSLPVNGRHVQILGARTSRGHRWEFDLHHFEAALAVATPQEPPDLRILLYHTPDLAPQAAAADVDLYLCGHTHGGQIRMPIVGALRTGSRFGRRYVLGLNRLPNGGVIHTSPGIGFEGMHLPRVRVLCPPVIAIFDVTVGG
ncbi:MAG TPA: metallophosphoesterase [Chloroflexia bacterium]|nr:metallophosphoesterase [Chloroflexia bacterium]